MQRLAASLVICLLITMSAFAQGMVEEFESPADLATHWNVTRPMDANAQITDGRLVITHDYDMRFRPGVTLEHIKPITLTGKRVLLLAKVGAYDHGNAQKKDLFNNYNFKLGDKLASLSVNRSINKDVVRFFINGEKVWDSYPFDRDRLFAPDVYIGFLIDGKDWKVICTDDPSDLKLMRPADKSNSSQGQLKDEPTLAPEQSLSIAAGNVHGRAASWSIDRLLVQP